MVCPIHPPFTGLLSQNRIADFHMELERLDPTQLHSNIYLKHPVSLEQYLMEGVRQLRH